MLVAPTHSRSIEKAKGMQSSIRMMTAKTMSSETLRVGE
jgi:hypothetical protein